jgi:hypothetical protein
MGLLDGLKAWYDAHPPPQPPAQQFPRGMSYGSRFPANNPAQAQPAASPSSYALVGETRSVVLNGSGNGSAMWTPGQAGAPGSGVGASRSSGYTVDVTAVAVSVAPAPGNTAIINQAQAALYVSYGIQSATPSDFQGQTPTGSTGDTDTLTGNAALRPGDWITVKWSGGDAGATATMQVMGTVNPPGVG